MSTADRIIELGFDVVEATSGDEALQMLHSEHAPDLSGAELAGLTRVRLPGLPVLIVSG